MKEKLKKIREDGLEKIKEAKNISKLEEVRKELTGKKSKLAEALKSISTLSPEDKKQIGMITTKIKTLSAVLSLSAKPKSDTVIDFKF